MRIAYGYQVKENNDPFLTDVEVAVEQFSLSTAPGGFLVNLVPSCAFCLMSFIEMLLIVGQCDIYQLGSQAQVLSRPLPFGPTRSLTWLKDHINMSSNRW
jgi:hypothetical protein